MEAPSMHKSVVRTPQGIMEVTEKAFFGNYRTLRFIRDGFQGQAVLVEKIEPPTEGTSQDAEMTD
jgi:hypothetical protein